MQLQDEAEGGSRGCIRPVSTSVPIKLSKKPVFGLTVISHRDLYAYAWIGAYADAHPHRRP
jgi:hypothetical protein